MAEKTPYSRRGRWIGALVLIALCAGPAHLWAQEPAEDDVSPADVAVEESPESGDPQDSATEAGDAGEETTEQEGAPVDSGEETPGLVALEAPASADPAFRQALEDYSKAYERYAVAIQDYQTTINGIVEAEFNRRLAEINSAYDEKIRAGEAIERERRVEAIASFEQFLSDVPNDPEYTPDALFRLAELHFEKANDDYLRADERYQSELARYDRGEIADEPRPPQRDLQTTAALFRRLITDWPDFRFADGSYYLLAYVELQMGRPDVARDLWAQLIIEYPESRFVNESWLRIGEYHFEHAEADGPSMIVENLNLARQAYENAMDAEGSAFYSEALYKLAWTYYRLGDYHQAITNFKELVEYSDEVQRRTGRSGAALREEAVQYIAISLAEEDWDLGEEDPEEFDPDADPMMDRVRQYISSGQPYEREVMAQLADYVFERANYQQVVELYEHMLAQYPEHRDNPKIHEQIIVALHRDGQPEAAFAVRREMLEYYGPESAWFAYHERLGNDEALRQADTLVRDNLLTAATWYHEQAQNLRNEALVRRDPALLALTEERYAMAADAYENFLRRYPNDREVFQWNFYYAECLYYSAQYDEAFRQYQVVRELDIENNEYQEISAFNAIKALEFMISDKVERGELTPTAMAGADIDQAREAAQEMEEQREYDESRGEQAVTIEGEPVPELVDRYVTSMDRYVVLQLQNPDDAFLGAKFAFQAAKIYYDFRDYEEARRRFAWVVENYPEHEVAYLAGSLILETFRDENNYAAMAEWADRLAEVIRGEQADAVRAEVREFRLGALFKSAEDLYAAERYEEAAEEYLRLVNDAPDHQYASKALNNAAVAYEVIRKFDSALRLYERVYQEYPDDDLAGYAIYRVAVNSEQFFEYEKAIQHYQLFYDRYRGESPPELAAMGFDIEERRKTSLMSIAVLNESLQSYPEAAQTYTEYARVYASDENSADAVWKAAEVWEKHDDLDRMVSTLESYIQRFGGAEGQEERSMEARIRIAQVYEDRGDTRRAARWYQDVLTTYERLGLEPPSFFAAQAQFMLVEHRFREWEKLKIEGSVAQQGRLLQRKIEELQELGQEYSKVFGYRSFDWTLAANYRIGFLAQSLAESLYEVPIPFDEDSDEYFIYQGELEAVAYPLEEQAIERYERTIAEARNARVVNEWTKRTLEQLNRYRPNEYPLFKEERRLREGIARQGIPYLSPESYQTRQQRMELNAEEDTP
ncbi:hypothetical protein DL240_01960 [Lujinxingia litoralis]|uniref:Tetratricopeptide repeat protein n=1 Tax=Lujinxingia litoralis TaxID=2211119 RepID=A0A328CBP6_9DELT|nr:tetratricopeptide repeat protein [Lujinxingia litoralis]RAL25000.1 hypothetical protein DL240_01960 [Lujinxingia litoralis]